MRRPLLTLSFALLALSAFAFPVEAANLPLLDPDFQIVPNPHELNSACPETAPLSYGAMLQLIQNLMNAAISLGVIAFVLVLAYAGASFMLNPTNPEARSHARGMLINVAVGVLIVLAAWLVVDFVMKTLYNSDAVLEGNIKLGPWNEILAPESGDPGCILSTIPTAIGGIIGRAVTTELAGGAGQVLQSGGAGACSATTVANAAAQSGVRMTAGEANTFACLARHESSCGARLQNYSWNKANSNGDASTAYGAFQVTLKGNSSCYENSACYAAANVSGPLNCASAFDRRGFPIPGAKLDQCTKASANLACNTAAAHCVYQKAGNYSPWLADKNSSKQRQCINA